MKSLGRARRAPWGIAATGILLQVVLAGCGTAWLQGPQQIDVHAPLRPPVASNDSIVLEIILARCPRGQNALTEVWESIDETAIPPDARRELHRNGIRIGVLGGAVPAALAEILQLEDPVAQPAADPDEEAPPEVSGQNLVLDEVPQVTRHIQTYRRGRRGTIAASGVMEELPLLYHDGEHLTGQPLFQAQCIYALHAEVESDQLVRLDFTPEIHHGQTRNRFTAGEGMYWRLDTSKDRFVFDRLRTSVQLTADQMLVLAPSGNSDGSLGQYFHKLDDPDGPLDKVILIRLAQIPADLDLLLDELGHESTE